MLSNVKVVVTRQIKRESSSLPVAVRSSKTSHCLNSLMKVLKGALSRQYRSSCVVYHLLALLAIILK